MSLKYKHFVWIAALMIGFSVDWLFWEKPGGINFFILVFAAVLGGLIPAWVNKLRIPLASYLLLIPIAFFSVMTFIRAEPFTTVINGLITVSLLILFSLSLRSGAWLNFNFRDHLAGLFRFFGNAFTGGIFFFTRIKNQPPTNQSKPTQDTAEQRNFLHQSAPYLRGILLALPILVILSALLASADQVFNLRLQNLLQGFELASLGEYLFRLFYILVIGYLILAAYYFGLAKSEQMQISSLEENKPVQILGWIEALIILGSVNLLFLIFVSLQFTYLFGGQANIHLEGFTYAEYARRGFFELVAVAVISLGIYYLLSMFIKRINIIEKRVFSVLGVLLMAQVGTMLVSAFQRLTLYETAYGFTTLRTITHIFMIWLGVLLGSAVLMEIFEQFKRLALVLFLVLLGFTLTLSLLNVDRFIAQRNVEHAIAHNPLDASYLIRQLSDDGIPTLFKYWQAEDTSPDIQEALYATLACKNALREKNQPLSAWYEWHFSRTRAETLFERHQVSLEAYAFIKHSDTFSYLRNGQEVQGIYVDYFFVVNGEEVWCWSDQVVGN